MNTKTVKNQNFIVRFISKMIGMIEPEESGKRIADYIASNPSVDGKFYVLGKQRNPKESVINGRDVFHKLLEYSKIQTGLAYDV